MKNTLNLVTLPPNPNPNLRRPFFELTLRVKRLQIGIAIGINGLLVAIRRLDQRLLIAIGKWRDRR